VTGSACGRCCSNCRPGNAKFAATMLIFTAQIKKFGPMGEKTGWTYIDLPWDLACTLKPENRRAFRVKGFLDQHAIEGVGLVPMGEGNFILVLNAGIRKNLRKQPGDQVQVRLEIDTAERPLSADLTACLEDDPPAQAFFQTLSKSHQKYFSDWIESAKTDGTKTNRIVQSLNALAAGQGFPEMIRANKKNSSEKEG
jgi:hypothetical protein